MYLLFMKTQHPYMLEITIRKTKTPITVIAIGTQDKFGLASSALHPALFFKSLLQ